MCATVARDGMTAILLATDGSEDARRAAEYAIDLARERDAVLHVLRAVDRWTLDEPAPGRVDRPGGGDSTGRHGRRGRSDAVRPTEPGDAHWVEWRWLTGR